LQPAAGLPLLHPPMDPATESSDVNSANDNPASKHFRWSTYRKNTYR
jgi:hypothetical protein